MKKNLKKSVKLTMLMLQKIVKLTKIYFLCLKLCYNKYTVGDL